MTSSVSLPNLSCMGGPYLQPLYISVSFRKPQTHSHCQALALAVLPARKALLLDVLLGISCPFQHCLVEVFPCLHLPCPMSPTPNFMYRKPILLLFFFKIMVTFSSRCSTKLLYVSFYCLSLLLEYELHEDC